MSMLPEDNKSSQGLFRTTFSTGESSSKKPLSVKGPSTAEDLDVRFAENFVASGGKFIYCESAEKLLQLLYSLKSENDWNFIFSWEHQLKDFLRSLGFKQEDENEYFMDNSDAAVSQCFSLLADEGVILLNPDQATNRRLTSFPPHHIIIANKSNLSPNLERALDTFRGQYFDKLPSLIELNEKREICKANHARLLDASGSSNVYVFYLDFPELA